jgi:ATP adenylyltransferase
VTDAWERLWTPHRLPYLRGQSQGDECPFCAAPGEADEASLVVHRGEVAYVVLNLFPYNSGHLLVCPYRHVADYTDLSDAETAEVAMLTQQSMVALRAASGAQGFNIGINQGSAAGAGIAGHLHQHVVPRWGGDTNFLPVIGATKTMPQLLHDSRQVLEQHWPH